MKFQKIISIAVFIILVFCINGTYAWNDSLKHKQTKQKVDLTTGQFRQEVAENILPYWMFKAKDPVNNGFYGKVTRKGLIKKKSSRSLVINARILWTFSEAYQIFQKEKYLITANRAYQYLLSAFKDKKNGGFFWKVDYKGKPVDKTKRIYAQAFCIYSLANYYKASGKKASLQEAKKLFALLEEHAYDSKNGGYFEDYSPNWDLLDELVVGGEELEAEKSMNTHLHIMEAYTALFEVWKNNTLKHRLRELITLFTGTIINRENYHFHLYFDRDFSVKGNHISFGHDIEGSWLLREASEVLGDEELIDTVKNLSVQMARATLKEAFADSEGLVYEARPDKVIDNDIHWWAQAEAVVGFYNAYQVSGDEAFKNAALKSWQFIQNYITDKKYGEWYKKVSKNGEPYTDLLKIGPWKGPYHNSRLCFEMVRRLSHKNK